MISLDTVAARTIRCALLKLMPRLWRRVDRRDVTGCGQHCDHSLNSAYAEYQPATADVVAGQATVAADKLLLPIPVAKHIDGTGGLLNDGITSHSGESGIPVRIPTEYLE